MARKWTEDETKELKILFDKGVPDVEIAKKFKRTYAAILNKRKKLGIVDNHKRRFTFEGKERLRESRKKYTKEKAASWIGGRRIHANGYIELHIPEHHRSRKNGYVFEHIVIAEKKIGRRLYPNEQVHHINEDKKDNRPENLEVMDAAEHTRHHAKSRRRGENKNCVVCNKSFYVKPSHVKRAKCCSTKCVGHYSHLKRKGELA